MFPLPKIIRQLCPVHSPPVRCDTGQRPPKRRFDLIERQREYPVKYFLEPFFRRILVGLAASQLAGERVIRRMLDRTAGVEFRDQPRHFTLGCAFVPLPQRPPKAREQVKSAHGFIESLPGMRAQQSEFTWLQARQDINIPLRCTHLSPPFFGFGSMASSVPPCVSGAA